MKYKKALVFLAIYFCVIFVFAFLFYFVYEDFHLYTVVYEEYYLSVEKQLENDLAICLNEYYEQEGEYDIIRVNNQIRDFTYSYDNLWDNRPNSSGILANHFLGFSDLSNLNVLYNTNGSIEIIFSVRVMSHYLYWVPDDMFLVDNEIDEYTAPQLLQGYKEFMGHLEIKSFENNHNAVLTYYNGVWVADYQNLQITEYDTAAGFPNQDYSEGFFNTEYGNKINIGKQFEEYVNLVILNLDSDSALSRFSRMLYLSMINITTLGYGDIVPLTTYTRMLVGIEAVMGIIILGAFATYLFKDNSNK